MLVLSALGARFTLTVDGADDLAAWLDVVLARLADAPDGTENGIEISATDSSFVLTDSGRSERERSVSGIVERLIGHLNRAAYHSDGATVKLHGAAVARRDVGVGLAARSGSGKSTLTTALVRRGWDYLSDEIVAVQLEQPVLTPYPKPISLKEGSQALFPGLDDRAPGDGWTQRYYAPDLVRPGCVSGPVPLRVVVFPRYEPGADAQLSPVHRADALYRLCEHSFDLRARGAAGLWALARAVAASDCFELELDDLAEAEARLAEALDDRAPRAMDEPEALGTYDDLVAWAVVEGSAVLLDLATGSLAQLDAGATRLWTAWSTGEAAQADDPQLAELLGSLRAGGFTLVAQ